MAMSMLNMGVDDEIGSRFYGRIPFLISTKKLNLGTWLEASVAFAFNSLAQGPVTPMGFAVIDAGIQTQDARFLPRHDNHSATGASPNNSICSCIGLIKVRICAGENNYLRNCALIN